MMMDITDVKDIKLKSMDCFKIHVESNLAGDLDKYHHVILGTNRYWGLQSSVEYAEDFCQIDIHEVNIRADKYLTDYFRRKGNPLSQVSKIAAQRISKK